MIYYWCLMCGYQWGIDLPEMLSNVTALVVTCPQCISNQCREIDRAFYQAAHYNYKIMDKNLFGTQRDTHDSPPKGE